MKTHEVTQRSDVWKQLRKGKITGTSLRSIMNPKTRQSAMYETIAERLSLGVEDDEYENARERGLRLEEEAIAAFEFETGLSVTRAGLCESDENEFIAYSPDGIISETEDLEVKCPGGKNYVAMWLADKIPEEYFWQVVQAFVVNPKLMKRYFVGYNPEIPEHPIHIIPIERTSIEAEIQKARETQEEFLKQVDEKLSEIIKL